MSDESAVYTAIQASVDQLTWPLFDEAIRILARRVRESGYHPDLILGVARGGLVPAAALAYALGVKQIATINVRRYVGHGRHSREPALLSPLPPPDLFRLKRILVVDDVADTGATLCLVKNACSGEALAIRTAVIYEKPTALIRSEYVWRRTAAWLDFPWEVQPIDGHTARSRRLSDRAGLVRGWRTDG